MNILTSNKTIVLILLIFIVMLLNPVYFVQSGQKAVIKRFGIVKQEVINEGIHIKTPFIDSVNLVNVTPQNVESEVMTYTKDNQPIDVKFNVLYVKPANDVANTVIRYNGMPYENFAAPKISDAFKAVAGQYTATEFVTKREEIRRAFLAQTKEAVKNETDNKPVITILDTPIVNVDFDDQYEQAIKSKQVMQQKAQQKEYEYQAAQKQAQITITTAKAEAESIQLKAQALKASPKLVEWEIANKWDGKTPTTVVTGGNGQNILLPIK